MIPAILLISNIYAPALRLLLNRYAAWLKLARQARMVLMYTDEGSRYVLKRSEYRALEHYKMKGGGSDGGIRVNLEQYRAVDYSRYHDPPSRRLALEDWSYRQLIECWWLCRTLITVGTEPRDD
ncbi:hypothetical protein BDQ17DRAFT_1332259 [Cyathus striatus]|nr:hypothetical protein BDQ17DRAFT_1332259 [Cyathus striatus]